MTDFRALCAELASALAEHQDKLEDEYHPDHPESARLDAISRLLDRARAALVQREPQSMSGHPIVPPPELVQTWFHLQLSTKEILVIAAQWGADTELEAVLHLCDEWLTAETIRRIRAARRPKPQTLNSIALEMLGTLEKETRKIAAALRVVAETLVEDKNDSLHSRPNRDTADELDSPSNHL